MFTQQSESFDGSPLKAHNALLGLNSRSFYQSFNKLSILVYHGNVNCVLRTKYAVLYADRQRFRLRTSTSSCTLNYSHEHRVSIIPRIPRTRNHKIERISLNRSFTRLWQMSHTSPPNILRCLALLMAAWGIHGFRPNFARRLVIVRSAERHSSTSTYCSTDSNTDMFAARFSTSGDVLEGTEKTKFTGFETPSITATTTTTESDERPWLGVGPDPMAEVRKNLPSALRTASGEVAWARSGGMKEYGVRVEEVWLNGPFKAPFPPQPVVSTLGHGASCSD